MQTYDQIRQVLDECSYKDWEFRLLEKGDGFLLQVRFTAPCNCGGEPALQSCRKWYISPHMCLSEIVNTAFLAVRVAEEHEVRERFKFRGSSIYDPHADVTHLAAHPLPLDER